MSARSGSKGSGSRRSGLDAAGLKAWAVRGIGLTLGALLVLGLARLASLSAGILILAFISILLASALEPIIERVRTRLPLGRGATILLVYAAFFATVLALAFVVVPIAVDQAERVLEALPLFLERTRVWAEGLRPAALATSVTAVVDSLDSLRQPRIAPDAEDVAEVGGIVIEAVVALGLVLTLVFFWLVEHARLQRYVLAFVGPDERAGARDSWNDIESRLGMWVRAQLILMGTIGLATTIAYTAIGLPAAVLLGLIAAFAEAIPIVGPLLGAIPAVLVAATVSPETALLVLVVYVLIQAVEGAVLVPAVMRNTVGISPWLVLLSLLIGGAAAGIIGAFLAVPLVASLEIILARFQTRSIPIAQDPSVASVEVSTDEGAVESRAQQAAVAPD
jgi:predicted PurR-regulated permease PerM